MWISQLSSKNPLYNTLLLYENEFRQRIPVIALVFLLVTFIIDWRVGLVWLPIILLTQFAEYRLMRKLRETRDEAALSKKFKMLCGFTAFVAAASFGAIIPILWSVAVLPAKIFLTFWIACFVLQANYNWSRPAWLSAAYWGAPFLALASTMTLEVFYLSENFTLLHLLPLLMILVIPLFAHSLFRATRSVGKSALAARDSIAKHYQEAIEAKKIAEEASNAKSEFLSLMGHELRTPLNVIVGLTQGLLQIAEDPFMRKQLEQIDLAGNKLTNMINDLIDLSKLDAGEIKLDPRQFLLAGLFQELESQWRKEIETKGLSAHFDFETGEDLLVMGDRERILQIGQTFLSNAIKFTSEGSVTLRLHVDMLSDGIEEDDLSCKLYLSVSDTGPGIAKEQEGQIFQAFVQGDHSRERLYEGAGIGLPVASMLAKHMGGQIELDTKIGSSSGSTFSLVLELPVCEEKPELGHDQKAETQNSSPTILAAAQRLALLNQSNLPKNDDVTESDRHAAANEALESYSRGIAKLEAESADQLSSVFSKLAKLNIDKQDVFEFPDPSVASEDVPVDSGQNANRVERGPTADRNSTSISQESGEPDGRAAETVTLRILVAEDLETNRLVAGTLIDLIGHQSTFAMDGLEAVERAQSEAFDLVLMDIRMPRMDGLKATKKIRELAGPNQNVPIVAVTADEVNLEGRELSDTGLDAVVIKPLRKDTLENILTKYVDAQNDPDKPPRLH